MTNIDGGIILTKIIEGHPAKDNKNEQLQPMINTWNYEIMKFHIILRLIVLSH